MRRALSTSEQGDGVVFQSLECSLGLECPVFPSRRIDSVGRSHGPRESFPLSTVHNPETRLSRSGVASKFKRRREVASRCGGRVSPLSAPCTAPGLCSTDFQRNYKNGTYSAGERRAFFKTLQRAPVELPRSRERQRASRPDRLAESEVPYGFRTPIRDPFEPRSFFLLRILSGVRHSTDSRRTPTRADRFRWR